MAKFNKSTFLPKKDEIKRELRELFAKHGLNAYDVRVGIDDYGLSFQGDCKEIAPAHAILTGKEKEHVD